MATFRGWPDSRRDPAPMQGPGGWPDVGNLAGLANIARRLNPRHPISAGLVGWWPMDEGQGSRIRDLSIYGNHGTLAGVANPPTSSSGWGGGISQRDLRFDAVDDLITVPHSVSLNFAAEFSVSCWVSIKSIASYPTYVMKGAGGAGYPGPFHFSYESSGNYWFFATGNGINNQNAGANTGGYPAVLGKVYHLVGIHTGGAAAGARDLLYRDGILMADYTTIVNVVNNGTALGIGGRTPGTLYGANESLRQVRVWNRALSAAEVKQIYADPWIGAL